ncbi:response regulator receiver protein [Chloroflexus islandicus]|uniref:histidine kinase n=2 Tax=Chloroflexus islandicus TaxID=1707952 RepID=A0A178MBY1_9CHLR|nr:response regulator receiver protein [Chloroflexus islandicus]
MIGSSATIFVTLGWLVNRHITRPLTTLTYAAKRVASGWRETPIPIVGADEIGDLSRALAQLTNELNETIVKLEDRVAQRTLQLQRTLAQNEALLAQERRRSRSEQVLIDLSLALSHLTDEAAIYRCVVDTLATGKEPDDRIGIYTREADGTFWIPQVTHGYRRDPFLKVVASKTLEQMHANPCYIADLSAYPIQGFPDLQGSVVAATIQLYQQDYALLALYRPQPNAFTDDEIAYVGIAARLAGQALTRVRLVGSLQQAKEAAEAINRERSAFLARLDHDVRNPLNTIIAMGEMLREALTDRPAASEDAGTIARAGRRLLSRLNILLDSAKIESGMLTLQPEPFSLDTLLDDVLSEIAPLIRHNHNRLEVERPSHLGLIVADLNRLRHVLIHPLRFAAATTRHGAITVQVQRQTADAQRDVLAVTISDTGATLNEQHLKALLTPFALPSTESRRAGEGQGLALSRQLCELMGGSLAAYPRTPAGISFMIHIPIVLPREPDDPVAQTRYWPQPDIVLVTAIEARTLQNALEQVGWHVQRAASLAEAIAHVRRPPSALLIDTTHERASVEAMLLTAGWDAVPVIWLCSADSGEGAIRCARWPGEVEAVIRTVKTVLPRPQQPSNTILLIEDDTPTRLMIRHALESDGWHVLEAGNGAAGKTIWLSAKPALVILDLMLPDGDGLTLLHHIRQTMTTPVVVVTAKTLHHDEQSVLTNIGATVLQKGRYRRSDLIAAVRALAK